MTAYWCDLLWTGERLVEGALVRAGEDGVINAVEPGTVRPADAQGLGGLVIPGLANSHSHAFQRALRGRVQATGDFWSWREQMYLVAATIEPDHYRRLAAATFAEMALAGITTVGEFHYVHHGADGTPYANPNELGEAVIAAASDAGIRITLIDACYLHGGIGVEPDGAQRRFADADAQAWAERVSALEEGPDVRIGAAIHSVRAVDPDAAAVVAGWAGERSRPLHAHLSEQPAENEACVAAYGATPTAVLAGSGALDERFVAIHATHLSDEDIALLGGANVTCCLCPTTERDLGDGIGSARRLADAGAKLALGSDSNAVIDLFEEARAVELDERLARGERGIHAPEALLGAATAGGHACLGWPEGGRVQPGSLCDLVAIDLGGVRLAGVPRDELVAGLVFAATAADVQDVIVGGRPVVEGGRHVDIDVGPALAQAIGELA